MADDSASQKAIIRKLERALAAERELTGSLRDQLEAERGRARELCRDNPDQHRLLDGMPSIIVRFDADLRCLYINPAIQDVTGLPVEHFIGRKIDEYSEPANFLRTYEKHLKKVFATGKPAFFDYLYQTPKSLTYRQMIIWPESAKGGKINSVLVVSHDLSDVKILEMRLREAKEAAEVANRAKSAFLARMSHESRTPLNGIIGTIELALASDLNPKTRGYLRMARKSALTLLGIVNDLLDLSKIEAGRMELDTTEFDLRDMLGDLLDDMTMQAASKGLRLEGRIGEEVPSHVVGDELRLRQVYVNLIGNAIKYTNQGRITVKVSLASPSSEAAGRCGCPRSGSICLLSEVNDTGIGIPEDRLKRIFEPFTRYARAHHSGTGLGLSIAKLLVELMGGVIWVESQPGVGSSFAFTACLGTVEDERPALVQEIETAAVPKGKPLRVLLAEDNEVNRLVAMDMLTMLGHSAKAVENGRQALETLQQEPFDLVLMDVNMPEMDGEEATRIIRRSPPQGVDPHIPIIAMTAYAQSGDRERFLAGGMDDYLAKPIDLKEVSQVLERMSHPEKRFGRWT